MDDSREAGWEGVGWSLGSCLQQARLCFDRPSSVSHAQHLPAPYFTWAVSERMSGLKIAHNKQQTAFKTIATEPSFFGDGDGRELICELETPSIDPPLHQPELALALQRLWTALSLAQCSWCQWVSRLTRGRRPLDRPSHIYANRRQWVLVLGPLSVVFQLSTLHSFRTFQHFPSLAIKLPPAIGAPLGSPRMWLSASSCMATREG